MGRMAKKQRRKGWKLELEKVEAERQSRAKSRAKTGDDKAEAGA
jgi:hypothetical protein